VLGVVCEKQGKAAVRSRAKREGIIFVFRISLVYGE
jgi:hypothetical protein